MQQTSLDFELPSKRNQVPNYSNNCGVTIL